MGTKYSLPLTLENSLPRSGITGTKLTIAITGIKAAIISTTPWKLVATGF